MQFTIARDVGSLRRRLSEIAGEGRRIGLVPTMGALHNGHVSLIERARQRADAVVLSIFVNPRQFGPHEDFEQYPRMLEADSEMARAAGVALVYAPSVEDMYPTGHVTGISVGEMGRMLCGKSRPGHFDGVATVVAKLLLRALPHVAVFGEKDYQQLCIIRRMTIDLDIPVEIIGAPTLRESDGLAMSSRNAYLTQEEREAAPQLYAVLRETAARITDGVAPDDAIDEGMRALEDAGFRPEYLELRQERTLLPMEFLQSPARLLVAARLGRTRLIDNIGLDT